jgi:hypothetical protein
MNIYNSYRFIATDKNYDPYRFKVPLLNFGIKYFGVYKQQIFSYSTASIEFENFILNK